MAADSDILQPAARRWFDDLFNAKISKIPRILYHYTDAAGLIGMLESGLVWGTDYRFLNDKSELAHTRSLVHAMLEEKLSNPLDEISRSLYSEILKIQREGLDQSAFIFSLSEEEDDLSQWRGYAREGNGFTIGLCGQSIYRTSEPDSAAFGFCKVEYNHDGQRSVIGRALEDLEAELRRKIGEGGESQDSLIEQAA